MMPFMSPAEAFFIISFISSTVVDFSTSAVMSRRETVGVGTRIETPLSLSLSSGMTMATA